MKPLYISLCICISSQTLGGTVLPLQTISKKIQNITQFIERLSCPDIHNKLEPFHGYFSKNRVESHSYNQADSYGFKRFKFNITQEISFYANGDVLDKSYIAVFLNIFLHQNLCNNIPDTPQTLIELLNRNKTELEEIE